MNIGFTNFLKYVYSVNIRLSYKLACVNLGLVPQSTVSLIGRLFHWNLLIAFVVDQNEPITVDILTVG